MITPVNANVDMLTPPLQASQPNADTARQFSQIFVKTMLKSYAENIFGAQESQDSLYSEAIILPILAEKIANSGDFPVTQMINKLTAKGVENE